MSKTLTQQQRDILHHTMHNASGGRFCGGGSVMDSLVAAGFMRSLGRVSWCPDEYFGITEDGRKALAVAEASR